MDARSVIALGGIMAALVGCGGSPEARRLRLTREGELAAKAIEAGDSLAAASHIAAGLGWSDRVVEPAPSPPKVTPCACEWCAIGFGCGGPLYYDLSRAAAPVRGPAVPHSHPQ